MRPKNLDYFIRTWASLVNYPGVPSPSSPWIGNPTKEEPPGGIAGMGFVPSQPNAAQHHNQLFSDAFGVDQLAKTEMQKVLTMIGQHPVLNPRYTDPASNIPKSGQEYRCAFPLRSGGQYYGIIVGGGGGLVQLRQNGRSAINKHTPTLGHQYGHGDSEPGVGAHVLCRYDVAQTVTTAPNATGAYTNQNIHVDPDAFARKVRYLPSLNRWCVMFGDVVIGMSTSFRCHLGSGFSGWTVGAGSLSIRSLRGVDMASDEVGTLVVWSNDTLGSLRSMKSVDGGQTWTTGAVIGHTLPDTSANNVHVSVCWNPVRNKWFAYLSCLDQVAFTFTETAVYSSTDGLSWTLVAPKMTNVGFEGSMACYGDMLVTTYAPLTGFGLTSPIEVAYSLDQGITWHRACRLETASIFFSRGVTVCDGRLVFLSVDTLHVSDALGMPSVGNLT